MAPGNQRDVSRYYSNLYFWTQLNQQFRAFSGIGAHTIHRSLTDAEGKDFGPKTIHGLIEEQVRRLGPIDALDAGSGYGGTCLDLHRRLGGRWHGITISSRQTKIARRNAAAMDASQAVTFETASYDDPVGRQFNMVLGIESLIHSFQASETIANLASHLVPGGILVLVDDMPVEPFPEAHSARLADFKRMWRCPQMPSARIWSDYLNRAGCIIETVQDLTSRMRPRGQVDLDLALQDIRRKSWWRPFAGLGSVTDAEIGGLILEQLGRLGVVRYQMIVARKVQPG